MRFSAQRSKVIPEILIFAQLVKKKIRTLSETRKSVTLFTVSYHEMLAQTRLNLFHMHMLHFIGLAHTTVIYRAVTDIVNAIYTFRGDLRFPRVNLLKPTGHVMHQHFNIPTVRSAHTVFMCFVFI